MKYMTIDDLYNLCQSQNLTHFSSNESGKPIRVQVPSTFSKLESDETTLYADIKIMHTGKNLNKSNLTENAAKHCMKTLAYKPLLANIVEDENGEFDFSSHDFEEVENEDGEKETVYYEKQIGCFTADKPYMKYDEKYDHDYVYGRVAIPREYTKAAEIIERRDGTDVSVELEILEFSYDGKEKTLNLDDAIVIGCTCLGADVKPGMADAHISLESFSEKNNAHFTDELLEELKKFNKNFEAFSNKQFNEGGQEIVDKFNELLAQYNLTAEDIDFEYDGLSDEELEAKFAEVFGSDEGEEPESEPASDEGEGEDEAEGSEPGEDTESFDEEPVEASDEEDGEAEDEADAEAKTYSLTLPDGTVKTFSLSLGEVWSALEALVNDTYGELDNDYYSVDVYPDESKVIMKSWWSGSAYRQSYKRKKDTFSLEGERVAVHSIWVTDDEDKYLNDLKSSFKANEEKLSEVESKLAKYEEEPEKVELLNSDDYFAIKETDEYKELAKRENYFDLSKEELTNKLNEMQLAFAKKESKKAAVKFSAEIEKRNVGMIPIAQGGTAPVKRGRYGGIFAKKD